MRDHSFLMGMAFRAVLGPKYRYYMTGAGKGYLARLLYQNRDMLLNFLDTKDVQIFEVEHDWVCVEDFT